MKTRREASGFRRARAGHAPNSPGNRPTRNSLPSTRYSIRLRPGFSLLEIMVTVVVLSIAIIPLFDYFGSAPKRAQQTMHRALALTMASQLLERFRGLPYATLKELFGQGEEKAKETLTNDPIVRMDALPPDTKRLAETYQYDRDVVFEEIAGEQGLGLLKVYVRWKLGDVPPREVSLSRVVVDYTRAGGTS